jgi:hypothetical protein
MNPGSFDLFPKTSLPRGSQVVDFARVRIRQFAFQTTAITGVAWDTGTRRQTLPNDCRTCLADYLIL